MPAAKITFTLPAELQAAAEAQATKRGVTLNEYAKNCVRDALMVYVRMPVSKQTADTNSIARTQVETRFKKSMKES
jgi:hypothetical protein